MQKTLFFKNNINREISNLNKKVSNAKLNNIFNRYLFGKRHYYYNIDDEHDDDDCNIMSNENTMSSIKNDIQCIENDVIRILFNDVKNSNIESFANTKTMKIFVYFHVKFALNDDIRLLICIIQKSIFDFCLILNF